MSRIKILPENLANQIAAGEVVERPASVIKELVENAIDACATRIKVEVELGGRRLMRVADNGEGMIRDDAILAFERHATSKISELSDLDAIETLGFRGEALASIASVARVELLTKTHDGEAATHVLMEGGKLIDVKDAARPTGTTNTVRDLFFNTPARRNFMRSHATENFHIASTITHYALANPEIAFSLTNNGQEKIRVAPAKSLKDRAYQLFGEKLVESLLPVSGGREFVAKVSGFVSAPRERRTTRDSQYFFINGRFVKDRIISAGLQEGFRSVLPHGVYPVAFLFLDVPPEEIDVNVHPAKTEVRFRRAQAAKDVIAEAVRFSLKDAGIAGRRAIDGNENHAAPTEYSLHESGGENVGGQQPSQSNSSTHLPEPRTQDQQTIDFETPVATDEFEMAAELRSNAPIIGEPETPDDNSDKHAEKTFQQLVSRSREQQVEPEHIRVSTHFDSAATIAKTLDMEDISSETIRPLGQLHNSYIIAADRDGLLLIDQHVAHERILFDKFKKSETERTIESQNLLLPETIDLSPAQSAAFDEVSDDLEDYGFQVMKLSGRTIAIKSVPTDLPPSEVRNLFSEIIETIEKEKKGSAKSTLRDDIAASMACKAAIKINMKLTMEKMSWMIENLLLTSSPTTCPHGRPIILRLSMQDIERKFHRT